MSNFTPQQIEEFLQEFFDVVGARQYVGARYVPIFGRAGEDTIEWDDLAPYEPLTVVMHEGISYVSRRYVPTGIQITDTAYWAETYRFNAQVEQYRQQVLGFQGQIDQIRDDFVPFPVAYDKHGSMGQVLSSLSNGDTRWVNPVVVTSDVAGPLIDEWLDEHPEATTTVQDNSVTDAKLVQEFGILERVALLSQDMMADAAHLPMLTDAWYLNKTYSAQDSLNRANGFMCTEMFFQYPYDIAILNTNALNSLWLSLYQDDGTFIERLTLSGAYITIEAGSRFRITVRVDAEGACTATQALAYMQGLRVLRLNAGGTHTFDDSHYENLYDVTDTTDNMTFDGSTGNLTSLTGGVVTNYIPVHAGYPIKILVNHTSIFDATGTRNYKLAIYDGEKRWIATIGLNDGIVSTDGWRDFGVTGYVRLAFTGTGTLSTRKGTIVILSQDRPSSVPQLTEPLPMTEYRNLLHMDDANRLENSAFSESTGEIVTVQDAFITGYIPIRWMDRISFFLGNEPFYNDYWTHRMKVALYDANKNWVRTVPLNPSGNEYYVANAVRYDFDGYFRVGAWQIGEFTINTTRYPLLSRDNIGTDNTVDVIMFAGQSNMAGRGTAADAPVVPYGVGWEYRAITAPNMLSPMTEPFGVAENNSSGINDGNMKTGSLVSAFTISYYRNNGNIPVVGISASKGGSGIDEWQPSGPFMDDALSRLSSCVSYLEGAGFSIRHKYLCWCQGEHDYDTSATYQTRFDTMFQAFKTAGIEKCLMIRVGNSSTYNMADIIAAQTEMAQTESDIVMASTDYAGMLARGLMKSDGLHYTQAGYNECGDYAGVNAGIYASTGKEPTMYDPEYTNLYYCHKN